MGTDFTEFLAEPRTFEATDAVARDYLPGVLIEQAAKPAPRRALEDGEVTTTTTSTVEETTTTTLPPEESTTTLDPAEDETITTLADELLTEESTTTLAPEDGTTGELAPEPESDTGSDTYNLSPILDARPPAGVKC